MTDVWELFQSFMGLVNGISIILLAIAVIRLSRRLDQGGL